MGRTSRVTPKVRPEKVLTPSPLDKEEIKKEDKKISVHEFWMAFRRRYHKVKEGHRPKLTHEEVEEMLYELWEFFP